MPCRGCRKKNPPVTASPIQPPLGEGAVGTGERIATGALRPRNDRSRRNLRVIPRPVRRLVVGIRNTPVQIQRGTDCHTSDIGHWFAMTGFFHELQCKSGRRGEGTPPYNHTLCRAGPVCPAGGALENRFGSSGRPTPTLHSTIELRSGGRPCPPGGGACFPFPSCISPGFAAYWGCSILH